MSGDRKASRYWALGFGYGAAPAEASPARGLTKVRNRTIISLGGPKSYLEAVFITGRCQMGEGFSVLQGTKTQSSLYGLQEPVFTTAAHRLAGLFPAILRRFPLPYVSMAAENLLV